MAEVCQHENQNQVGDMPIADPDTLEFVGRFDVVMCVDCGKILSKTPVVNSELAAMFPTNTEP